MTRREERQEGEVHETYDTPRSQTTPLPGTRPGVTACGPRAAAGCGQPRTGTSAAGQCCARRWSRQLWRPGGGDGRRCCSVLPPGASLAAQQQEEEEAKEQAAVAELEAQVAAAEDLLLVQLQREREGSRVTRQTWSTLSRVEQLAVHWFLARVAVEKKKDKWKRKEKEEEAEEYSTWLFWEMTAFVLGSCVRFSSCSPVCVCREECRARVDNDIGMLRLVFLVSTHFALCSLLLFPLRFFLAVASSRLVLLVTMYLALCSLPKSAHP